MKEHECVVGELHHTDYSHIVTLSELKEHIDERLYYSRYLKEYHYALSQELNVTAYTLSDYADKRKSTDLTRFDFCPYCGKKIDWKSIKKGCE